MEREQIHPFTWSRCDLGYRWVTGLSESSAWKKPVTVLVPNAAAKGPDARPEAYKTYAPEPGDELFFTVASTPRTEEGILAFATAHGYLGIRLETVRTPTGTQVGESLADWKSAIGEVSYVVERWEAARGKITYAGDEPGFAWIDLRNAFEQHLGQNVAPELVLTERRGSKRPQSPEFLGHDLKLVAQNLWGYLWLELALAVKTGSQFRRCPSCQKLLVVSSSGIREPQISCSDSCRSRLAYYRGLHRAGRMSPAEIARRMGSSVPAVREWIGRTPEVVEKMRATRAARPRMRLKREAGTDLGVARLADPETVRVKPWRESLAKNKWLTINRSDFDPAKHELFEEKAKPKVAAHRSHHQPKLAQPRRAVVH